VLGGGYSGVVFEFCELFVFSSFS
jgi:hypothetical protein